MLLHWIERYFDLTKSGEDEYLTQCCFHDDDKPSLSVNVAKRQFYCHACGEKGDVPKLLARKIDYHPELIRYELNWLASVLKWKLPAFRPDDHTTRLKQHDDLLKHLTTERFWSLETIEECKIGWDGSRVTIPVINIFGDIVNVRKYKPKAGPDDYKVINIKGFGKARLFGLQDLKGTPSRILLTEGEPDTLAARSVLGPAVSSTAGAKTFLPDWAPLFGDATVYVCYDGDKAGREGSDRAVAALHRGSATVKVVGMPEGQDFTDVLAQAASTSDVEDMVEAATTPPKSVVDREENADQEIHDVSLSDSSERQYYRKRVRLRVMVSGKTLAPYIVPEKVEVTCTLPALKMCTGCGLHHNGGRDQLCFGPRSPELLQLVETPIDSHTRIFRDMCGIPPRCKLFTADVTEAQNVEEVKVIPNLDFTDDDSQYVIRQVYYMGHGLRPNSAYEVTGLTLPHPKTQQVTYLSNEAIPLEDTVSAFQVTEELIQQLRVFQCGQDKEETE